MKLSIPNEIADVKTMYEVTHEIAEQLSEYLKSIAPKKDAERMTYFLMPNVLVMEILEKLLKYIPPEYCRMEYYQGHQRLMASGTYEILKPIPSEMYVEALRKAHIIQ